MFIGLEEGKNVDLITLDFGSKVLMDFPLMVVVQSVDLRKTLFLWRIVYVCTVRLLHFNIIHDI